MLARRFIVVLAIAGFVLASFASFCTRMGTTMIDMGMGDMMRSQHMMSDCAGRPATCPVDVMQGLFQSIPVSLADEIILLLTSVVVAYFLISYFDLRKAALLFQDRIRVQRKRAHLSFHRPSLVLAFSRGIIHPKRYAE